MIYGWDVSTSIVGVSFFSDDGRFSGSSFFDLRKIRDIMGKADIVMRGISGFQHGGSHFVEDKLGGFAGGRTSQQTLMKLAAFNGIVSWMIHSELAPGSIEHIHPSTVKSILKDDGLMIPKGGDKKKLTLAWAREKEQSFPYFSNKNGKTQPYCYDMADSYAVARAGFIRSRKRVA